MKRPYLLLSNDDGVSAPGLQFLIQALRPMADLLVVAPDGPRSGFSCSITSTQPLRYREVSSEPGLSIYACTGTPVDCVKLALNVLAERRPDMVVGGINHGDNASVNAHYSGTMGVATEGALQGLPAVAFSLCDFSQKADFSPLGPYLPRLVQQALDLHMQPFTCLNINFPLCSRFNGIRVCRMAKSRWEKEVEMRRHPFGPKYFWLVGECRELEPEAPDTDRWALAHGYVAITPVNLDITHYGMKDALQGWNEDSATEATPC